VQELDDCEAKFKLIQQQFALEQEAHQSQQGGGPEEPLSQLSLGSGGSGPRRPQKSTPYLLSLRAGLGGWARGLGLTAVQLAENVEAGYLKHKHAEVGVGGAAGCCAVPRLGLYLMCFAACGCAVCLLR
jgi:hypothetical protein